MTWCDSHLVSNFSDFYQGKPADKYPLFLIGIGMGWWMTCGSLQSLDSMELSSPCQPWCGVGGGSLKFQEGWATISGLVNAALLKPKIILVENASAIMDHQHWPAAYHSTSGFEIWI